jgi:hypothetical protein
MGWFVVDYYQTTQLGALIFIRFLFVAKKNRMEKFWLLRTFYCGNDSYL